MQLRLIVASCVSYTESIFLQKTIGIREVKLKKHIMGIH